MTEEEAKEIIKKKKEISELQYYKYKKDYGEKDNITKVCKEEAQAIEIILKALEEKQKELGAKNLLLLEAVDRQYELNMKLEEKDKQIDLMTEYISNIDSRFCRTNCNLYEKSTNSCSGSCEEDCEKNIRQYFKTKAKEE